MQWSVRHAVALVQCDSKVHCAEEEDQTDLEDGALGGGLLDAFTVAESVIL